MTTTFSLSNRNNLKVLRDDVNAALEAVGKKHNLKLSTGNIKYDTDGLSCTMQLKVLAAPNGEPVDEYKRAFDSKCMLVGLKPEHFGVKFKFQGMQHELAGMRPGRSYKLVLKGEGRDGLYNFKDSVTDKLVEAILAAKAA